MLQVGHRSVSIFPNFWLYMGLSTVYISLHHPHAFLFVNKWAFDQIRVKLQLRICNTLEIWLCLTSKKYGWYFSLFDFFFISFPEVMLVHPLREEQIFLHSSHMKHSPHSFLEGSSKLSPKWSCSLFNALWKYIFRSKYSLVFNIWISFWALLLTIMEFPDPLGVCMLCPVLRKSEEEKQDFHEN